MAKTPSNMLALGTEAPHFSLPEPGNSLAKATTFANIQGAHGTVVMFICNHCPYVIHVIEAVALMVKTYQSKGIGFVAINSNDVEKYPDDSPENMIKFKQRYQLTCPYLFDETQQVAKAYDAACTPDIYLFDADQRLAYRGQLDGSRPGNKIPSTCEDLINAMEAVIHQRPVELRQIPSIGCNIKWRNHYL